MDLEEKWRVALRPLKEQNDWLSNLTPAQFDQGSARHQHHQHYLQFQHESVGTAATANHWRSSNLKVTPTRSVQRGQIKTTPTYYRGQIEAAVDCYPQGFHPTKDTNLEPKKFHPKDYRDGRTLTQYHPRQHSRLATVKELSQGFRLKVQNCKHSSRQTTCRSISGHLKIPWAGRCALEHQTCPLLIYQSAKDTHITEPSATGPVQLKELGRNQACVW